MNLRAFSVGIQNFASVLFGWPIWESSFQRHLRFKVWVALDQKRLWKTLKFVGIVAGIRRSWNAKAHHMKHIVSRTKNSFICFPFSICKELANRLIFNDCIPIWYSILYATFVFDSVPYWKLCWTRSVFTFFGSMPPWLNCNWIKTYIGCDAKRFELNFCRKTSLAMGFEVMIHFDSSMFMNPNRSSSSAISKWQSMSMLASFVVLFVRFYLIAVLVEWIQNINKCPKGVFSNQK